LNDSNFTDAQKEKAIEKATATKSAASYNNIWLGVSRAAQQNGYYCGPATVYQQLSYLEGSSPSQSFLAGRPTTSTTAAKMDKLDTDYYGATPWDYVQRVLNYYLHSFVYTKSIVSSKTDFKNKVDYTLRDGAPIALLVATTSAVFGYTSTGHFLSIAGQNTGATQYLIVDPNRSSSSGQFNAHYIMR
jgi:hypothetical protein